MSEDLWIEKRFLDLSRQAANRGIAVFSDFLTLNELNIFHQSSSKYAADYALNGGYEFAERQIAAFLPDALSYRPNYPIDCLKLGARNPKFAEQISHRDILGAVMNLGIERGKIGDILVKDSYAYIFCKKEISDYICEELYMVRRTAVQCEKTVAANMNITPNLMECDAIVASNRMDNIVAALTNLSRSDAVRLIQSGKVFIQGKECLQNTYVCRCDDMISIRGYGKFRFNGEAGMTRKNRLKINYQKYI